MNKRQKKKRYKKLYGVNPLKGLDGRYMYQIKCKTKKKRELSVVTTARILAQRRKK